MGDKIKEPVKIIWACRGWNKKWEKNIFTSKSRKKSGEIKYLHMDRINILQGHVGDKIFAHA